MNTPTVWVVRAGVRGSRAHDFEAKGVAAIGFDDAPGDPSGTPREAYLGKVKAAGGSPSTVGQVWRFANEISVGDIVVVPLGESRELLFGEVTGAYRHDPSVIDGFSHIRDVNWGTKTSRDVLPKTVLYSLGSLLTVFIPSGQDELLALARGEAPPLIPRLQGDDEVGGDEEIFQDLQARSNDLIDAQIVALDGYGAQNLFAGILRALGYHARVSPPGPDGGWDIYAARDPLFVQRPVLRVQVKARPNTASSVMEVRELAGVCEEHETGIFVSTGGFTKDARLEASKRKVTLVTLDDLRQLLLDAYDDLDQDTKALVPLRRVYLPA